MGVTIHYRLGQKENLVKKTLDSAQVYAQEIKKNQAEKTGIPFEIIRVAKNILYINIGKCETLALRFDSMEKYRKEEERGWSYEVETLKEISELNTDLHWCSAFCKTQYGKLIEHKWVADILKVVASRCRIANVNDEGEYYHTEQLEDAEGSILENAEVIKKVGEALTDKFGSDNVIKGGETQVKKRK